MKRFLPLIALAVLFSSCVTEPPPASWTGFSVSGIDIRVRPASRESLEKRYGASSQGMNPLLDYSSLFSQKRLLVFEMIVESTEYAVELVTRQTTIDFEGMKPGLFAGDDRALDEELLREAWEGFLKIDNVSNIPEMEREVHDALPGNLKARPGEPASGYLVFLNRFPKYGVVHLSLLLRASNGDTGTVSIRVEIEEPGKPRKSTGIFAPEEGDKPENTGIFGSSEEASAP